MEAPEKIYIQKENRCNYNHILNNNILEYDSEWTPIPLINEENIEYIRADAFIEKALAYLNDKFYFNNLFYGIVSTDFHAMEEMYEDFKNYMKGE